MRTQMLTSRLGGELVSFKVNGEEKNTSRCRCA